MPTTKLLRGADGRSLDEVWGGSPRGYLGTTVHGFPNAFVMLGPNAGINTAAFVIAEAQARYVAALVTSGAEVLDVRQDVQDAYNARVDADLVGKVWSAGNCASYFIDENGRNSFHFPGTAREFERLTGTVELADYLQPEVLAGVGEE
jgi:cyclohexanone monooxygenase